MDIKEKKYSFNEALSFLTESAIINNGILTENEIHEAFKDLDLSDNDYKLIDSYFAEQNIKIKGTKTVATTPDTSTDAPVSNITADTTKLDDSEKKILNMYMSELKNNHSYSDQEKLSLIETLVNSKAKDSSITNKLVEAYLNLAIDLSKEYAGKGISIADLIAEGNLALIESINSYKQAVDLTTFKNQLTQDITNAMTKLILEQDGSSKIGNHVADRANLLDRASRELSEKLGKTPTLQELAEYVSLPEDEVQRIMQISLDAMNASLNPDQ